MQEVWDSRSKSRGTLW